MISGMLHKRVYSIGGKPELVIYSDSSTGLDTIELRNELDPTIIPENDAVEIFLLGGVMADKVSVEISSSASIIFSSQSVIIRSYNSLRFGDWYGKARTITDLQNRCAVISVPGMRYFKKDFVARFIFRPVLDRLLFEKGYIPLHASCAVKGEKACIIAGAAGSGKSTLLWGLLEKGMSFISDDRLLVKEKEGVPFYTHSFPEFIRLPVSERGPKHQVRPPDFLIHRAIPGLLLLLDNSGIDDHPSILSIGRAEAAARLLQFSPPYMEDNMNRKAFDVISEICRNIDSFLVKGCGSIRRRLELVQKIIDKHL